MAAVRHLGFVKFEIFTVKTVKGHILHQRTKFHKDRSNRYGDIAIFVICQYGGRRHFGFSKIRNFNDRFAVRGQLNLIKIGQTVAEIQRFNGFFQNLGRPPSWICWAPIGITHGEFLMVSIVCKISLKSMQ